jgi:type IV pilus assembly protein PilC
MPQYSYIALNEKGRKIRGTMSAANEVDLEERLHGINLDLIESSVARTKGGGLFSGNITAEDVIVLCIHLEQLEKAGVPILEAISDLRDTADSMQLKNLMAEIYESVKGGRMLSAALAEHPEVFSRVFTGLVSAGEKTGNLHEVFFHLSKHLKWINTIRRKIKKAIYYPAFLLILMTGITSLMMAYVIPKLSKFLTAQSFELPLYTKALIATSDFFVDYWYVVLLGPFVVYGVVKVLIKVSDDFAYNVDMIKLSLPWFGTTIRKIEMARFCHFFALTYRSGLGILECLDIAQHVLNNKVISEGIYTVRKSIMEGASLTDSLRLSNQLPNLVIRMFKVGEESGNLDTTLENVNFFYDREVEDSVNNMIGVIQPALTIIMGGLMLWISIAVFGPLYNSFSQMSF